MKDKNKGVIILLVTALIWGFSLVAQQAGMDKLGPWSFTGVRSIIGSISMVPLVVYLERKKKKNDPGYSSIEDTKKTLKMGAICGLMLMSFIILQQYGLLYTGVGKAAFITDFYIFLTPLIGIFLGIKVSGRIWIAVVFAMIGLYFITMSNGFDAVNKGDIIMFGAALTYAIYMHVVDRFVRDIDVIKLAFIQFVVLGLVSTLVSLFLEPGVITGENIKASLIPILYAGILSCVGGYTGQMVGQSKVDPTTSSLVLSLEAVFSVMAGWMILHEILTVWEYLGCLIMMGAIVISIIPEKGKGKNV